MKAILFACPTVTTTTGTMATTTTTATMLTTTTGKMATTTTTATMLTTTMDSLSGFVVSPRNQIATAVNTALPILVAVCGSSARSATRLAFKAQAGDTTPTISG